MEIDTTVGFVSGILPQRSSRVHAGSLSPAECSVTFDNVAVEQLRHQKIFRRHMHMSTFLHATTSTQQHSLSLCSVRCIIIVRDIFLLFEWNVEVTYFCEDLTSSWIRQSSVYEECNYRRNLPSQVSPLPPATDGER